MGRKRRDVGRGREGGSGEDLGKKHRVQRTERKYSYLITRDICTYHISLLRLDLSLLS